MAEAVELPHLILASTSLVLSSCKETGNLYVQGSPHHGRDGAAGGAGLPAGGLGRCASTWADCMHLIAASSKSTHLCKRFRF